MKKAVLLCIALSCLLALPANAQKPREIVISTFPIGRDPLFTVCREVME